MSKITEGLEDAKWRAVASDYWDDILSDVKSQKKAQVADESISKKFGGRSVVFMTVRPWAIVGFVFPESASRTSGSTRKSATGAFIILVFIESADTVRDVSDVDLPRYLAENFHKWEKEAKSTFIHEFIHVMDYHRLKGQISPEREPAALHRAAKEAGKAGDLEKEKELDTQYFNHPLEYNAYVQQFLKEYTDFLSSIKNPAALKVAMGKSAGEMYRKFLNFVAQRHRRYNRFLDLKKYGPKLKKRIAQLWNDLHKTT